MRCSDMEELLSAYANDELSQTQREFVEEHIADCPDCRVKLEDFTNVRRQLLSLRDTPAVTDIRETTMATIKKPESSKNSARRWLRPALVTAPIIAILAVLITWQPWISSPQSILVKAKETVAELQSYRIAIRHMDENEEITYDVKLEYNAPDRYHYTSTGDEPEHNREYILIGDEAYFKTETLQSSFIVPTWSGVNNYSSLISSDYSLKTLDYLKDIKELPETTIDGTVCLHYGGTYDYEKQIRTMSERNVEMGIPPMSEEDIQERLEKFQEGGRTFEVELWIGKDDYLIRQMKRATSVLDDSGKRESSITNTKLYDFNEPFTIEAPRDSQGKLLPGWTSTVPDYSHISADISTEVDNYDPSNRRVNYVINITNTSNETLTDVDVRINEVFPDSNIDIAYKVWFKWENGQYHDGPYTLDPEKILKYGCTFGYDATSVESELIAEAINNSDITVIYTQTDGQRKVEIFYLEAPESIYTLSTEVPAHLIPVDLTPAGEYRLEEPGATYTGNGVIGEIDGKGYLFVEVNTAGAETPASPGILVLDIEDKTSPQKVTFISTGDDTRYIRGATLHGSVLYVSADDYLWVLDVSDPSEPEELARLPGLDTNRMIISENYAFINDGNHDIVTLDLSDPANPEKIGNLPLSSGTGIQMDMQGDYIFAEASDIFYTIDASSPSSLEIVNEHSFQAAIDDETPYITYPLHRGSWRIKGDYIYLSLHSESKMAIQVLDISEPASSREVTMLKLKDRTFGFSMFVSGDSLYLFTRGSMGLRNLRNSRLEFIDISNPAEPVEKGFGIMPDSWKFFPEPSGSSHNTYNLIDDYLYWFIGDSPNMPVIEIFDLMEK